jgi:DNA replication protein DnaC
VHRLYEQALADAGAGGSVVAPRLVFVSGLELSGARRRARIGAESELVRAAIASDLLLLDEIGFEPPGEELPFVVDARYRQKRPTVVTTGLRVVEFRARYGDALWRRLAEGGAVVEAWL